MATRTATAGKVKREVLALPANPNTASAVGVYKGWNVTVRHVYDPEAVREGRRVMEELLIQSILQTVQAELEKDPKPAN